MHLRVSQISHILCFVLGCSFTILITSINLKSEGIDDVFRKEEFQLFVIVLSSPDNFIQRYAIRQTWLRELNPRSQYVFVVGSLNFSSQEQRKTLLSEQNEFNDILMLPVVESYDELTKKMLASLVHVFQNYKFEYLLKTDDDTFVNLKGLYDAAKSINKEKPFYWGYFYGNATVFKDGKWKENQWFLCDKYLPYALGGGYVLSSTTVRLIVDNVHFLSTYKSEDVSVGVWLSPYNITRIHDIRFDTAQKSRGCSNSHLITHKQSPEQMRALYNRMTSVGSICSVENIIKSPYEYDWSLPPTKCCLNTVTL